MSTIYCDKCDDFVEYNIVEKEEERNVMGKDNIIIDSKIAICNHCGTELFHKELEERNQEKAFNLYRDKNNILYPEKIKAIRDKYGLTQKEMSNLLGWGDITYHRYENGSLPDQAHNTLLLLIEDPKNVRIIIENNKHNLSSKTLDKLKNRLEELLDKKDKRIKELKMKIKEENIKMSNAYENRWKDFDDKPKLKLVK